MSNDCSSSQISGNKSVRINKYCENKVKYFEYNAQIAKAFKKDCEKFLLAFEARKDLDLEVFADVWRVLSFGSVLNGQEFMEELAVFANAAFFTIKKYIIFSNSIYIRAGAFYLLHRIYTKQLVTEQVRIRLTLNEYKVILRLVQEMKAKENLVFVYLFKELKYKQAFQFVAEPLCYGLEAKFAWQEKKMRDDIFLDVPDECPMETIDSVAKDAIYGLDGFDITNKQYEDALKEYVAETGNTSILVEHVTDAVQNLKTFHHQLTSKINKKDVPAAPESSKMGSVKQQAYVSTPGKVKPFTSTRE